MISPQASESTPGQVGECFPAHCMCGRVSHCPHIEGARLGTLVQTRVIDALAGRADTFSDEELSSFDLPRVLCTLGLPFSP